MDRRIGASMARNSHQDTPAEIEWRRRHNAACDQAGRETRDRFPVLNADNIDAALKFQEDKIKELMNGKA